MKIIGGQNGDATHTPSCRPNLSSRHPRRVRAVLRLALFCKHWERVQTPRTPMNVIPKQPSLLASRRSDGVLGSDVEKSPRLSRECEELIKERCNRLLKQCRLA